MTHRLRTARDPDHMDMDLVDPHPPTSLTCGSWSVAVRMTQHGLGFRGGNINTAFSFRLFSLFFTLFPSNSSKPPTFSCWLTSPCLPEKASSCQELGGAGGLWWTEKSSCADGPLSISPPTPPSHWAKASCRFPLPGSHKLLQQPLTVTRAAFQLPELWLVQEKLCCFMLLLDEISAISASTPPACSCRLLWRIPLVNGKTSCKMGLFHLKISFLNSKYLWLLISWTLNYIFPVQNSHYDACQCNTLTTVLLVH